MTSTVNRQPSTVNRQPSTVRNTIFIKGARPNNLNNIDLALPKNKLIVVPGVSASGKTTYLTIYSRKQAPEIADAIHALTGETDAQKADAFFTTVASQAIPSADAQQIQDWLAKTRPTLSAQGSKATLTVGGANLVLANPNGLGLALEIGEIK